MFLNPYRFGTTVVGKTLREILADVDNANPNWPSSGDLDDNLFLCLDAADAASYDGTAQRWLDTGTQGSNFRLGHNTSVETRDPTFNGAAGRLTAEEYFATDGGDFFSYEPPQGDVSILGWMDKIQRARASTLGVVVYVPESNAEWVIIGNSWSDTTNGFRLRITSTELPEIWRRGSGGIDTIGMGQRLSTDAWHFIAFTFNGENSYTYVDGVRTGTFNTSDLKTGVNNNTQFSIWATGAGSAFFAPAGARIALVFSTAPVGSLLSNNAVVPRETMDAIYDGIRAARPGYNLPARVGAGGSFGPSFGPSFD